MSSISPYERIRSIAIDKIKLNMDIDGRRSVYNGEIEDQVNELISQNPNYTKIFEKNNLVNDLKMKFSIKVVQDQILISNEKEKSGWYDSDRKKSDREIGFWSRYESFIRKKIPGLYAQQLDDCTNQVMENIEDPNAPGEWDKRGLVMGSVQSGKTSQIVGVVNKALDAGYNFIVILTGMTNDLRSQTQARVDEGVLGIETFNEYGLAEMVIGVGTEGTVKFEPESFTNSSNRGDISLQVFRHIALDPTGRSPRILVTKKKIKVRLRN